MNYQHNNYSYSFTKAHKPYCSLFKACPYLAGEPARKVLSERNYFRARIQEMEEVFNLAQNEINHLRQRISSLEQENNHLKANLAEARQALFNKPSRKNQNKNSHQNPPKRGAPFGHPPHYRKKTSPYRQVCSHYPGQMPSLPLP